MAQDRRALVQEATRRLARNKDPKARRGISDFVKQNGLTEDIELAMRMLESEMLTELLAGREDLEWKLAEVDDKSALVLTLISQLDADVEALVKGIKAADGGSVVKGKGAAAQNGAARTAAVAGKRSVAEAGNDEKVLAKALERVDAKKTPLAKSSIERFVKEWEFGEEVELSLMLLVPMHLREFFAGEADLVQKMAHEEDPSKLVLQIISMLDPMVPRLHAALQSQGSASAPPAKKAKAASPAFTPPPKAKAAPARPLRPSAKAPAARTQGGAAEPDQLLFQAEMRLRMNKTPEGAAMIAKFTQWHGLGDECELALRMLGKAMLDEFMAGRAAIARKLAHVADKDAIVLALVAGLDAEAVDLVKALKKTDSKAKGPRPPLSSPQGQAKAPRQMWTQEAGEEEPDEEPDPYAGHPML